MGMNISEQIKELVKLRDNQVITEQEFINLKKELIKEGRDENIDKNKAPDFVYTNKVDNDYFWLTDTIPNLFALGKVILSVCILVYMLVKR